MIIYALSCSFFPRSLRCLFQNFFSSTSLKLSADCHHTPVFQGKTNIIAFPIALKADEICICIFPLPNTRFENWLFSFFPDVYTRNSLGVCRADNCYGRFASRYWRERSQAVEIERKTLREPFHLNFWNASRVISCRFGKQTPSFMISELICAHDLLSKIPNRKCLFNYKQDLKLARPSKSLILGNWDHQSRSEKAKKNSSPEL